jgi:hypothetical protein
MFGFGKKLTISDDEVKQAFRVIKRMTADMRSERHAAFENIIDFIEGNGLDAAKVGPLIDGQGAIGLLMGVHNRSYNVVRKANPLLAAIDGAYTDYRATLGFARFPKLSLLVSVYSAAIDLTVRQMIKAGADMDFTAAHTLAMAE